MRRFLVCAFGVILSVCGIGCQSPSPQSVQTLRFNINDEPQTLDPRKARDLTGQAIARMLGEGLTRINSEEKAEFALLRSVEVSPDLKTYTFHLKQSFWSNGDRVTASDFVYTWKKTLSPAFPSDTAFHLYTIKNAQAAKEGKVPLDAVGVVAKDENTLIVELENPTPWLLELTALPVFFPVNQKVDENNPSWAQNASTHVGNGPFQLVEWKHQDHLHMKKNHGYWDAEAVALSSLELLMLPAETELKMYEKNTLDWAGAPLTTLPLDALKSLKNSNSLKTREMLGTYLMRVNTAREPFDDAMMRKAFAMAIDRKSIVDHVTQGQQIPATGLVPISLGLQKDPWFPDGDRKMAKQLFAEALSLKAKTKETFPRVTLMYPMRERNHLIAQALQQQWFETFGIWVKLEAVESKIYFDRVSKQDYDLSTGSWTADFSDPVNFLEVFKYKNGGSNNTQWEDPRFIALLDQSSGISDSIERVRTLSESEKILMDEMPVIPIFYYTMVYLSQPSLKGVVLSPLGQIDFKWAWIER